MPLSNASGTSAGRKLVAVVHADMVAYSHLIGLDDVGTLERLRALRAEVIDPAIADHGGRIVQTGGDSLLIVFDSIEGAVRCAVTIQQRVPNSDEEHASDRRIRFRMGVDIGDAIADGTDLHGDGVIVAARLQAECPPGGVCVSRAVRDHVHDRLDLGFESLGPLSLKNVARPVESFLVRSPAAPKSVEQTLRSRGEPLALPDKPSLVVLPFQNMSGDPEQEYFADGMVEEITTALSRIRALFVIARHSAFTYKGRAVDVRQVGRELGVRYVLEGSVRKAGSRVRITGQLIEAATGTHLWADRFEGTLEDVFDLQDRMTGGVVAAIEPNIRAAEIQRAQRKPAQHLQAYDLVLRALPHLNGRTQAGRAEAVRLLQQAVTTDPAYAPGLAYLGWCHFMTLTQGWIDRGNPAVADMILLVQSALALDPNDPEILEIAGAVTASGGDLRGGIGLVDRSIELNPNNAIALASAGALQAFSGDTAAAISLLNRSVRHNPLVRNYRVCSGYVIAYFVAGEYERVVEWSGKALQEVPHSAIALRYRAASLGLLGRLEEGRQVVQRLLDLVPNFTITRARRFIELDMNNLFKTPGIADALYEGLRRCGVPE